MGNGKWEEVSEKAHNDDDDADGDALMCLCVCLCGPHTYERVCENEK